MRKIFESAENIVGNVTGTVDKFNHKEQVSSRHETDMLADNKLSKNARPIALFFVLVMCLLCIVLSSFGISIPETLLETIFWATSIVLGFYFGGRSLEKYKKTNIKLERKRER